MHGLLRDSALIMCTVALALTLNASDTDGTGDQFKIVKQWPLEGAGGWDYVTPDPNSHRVYITRATHVSVLDSESDTVIGDIPDTPGVHGVQKQRLAAPYSFPPLTKLTSKHIFASGINSH
jgi:hypothetical protein